MNIQLRYRREDTSLFFTLSKLCFALIICFIFYHFFSLGNTKAALITLAAGCAFFLLLKLAWPRTPATVVMNEIGIIDRRSDLGMILWKDIIDAQIEVNGPFLCLRVKNPDDYISRLNPIRRETMQFHQSLGFRMLNIELKGFRVNLITLLDQVREKIKQTQGSLPKRELE